MLHDIVTFLISLLSDFGTLLMSVVAFWLALFLLSLLRPSSRPAGRSQHAGTVVRQFRLPSRGGRE